MKQNKTEQQLHNKKYNCEQHKTPTIQSKNFQESEAAKSH